MIKMIPSNAIAAVASSALRNYGRNTLSRKPCTTSLFAYLNEGIVLLIVALNSKYRFPRATGADTHFDHFGIEEFGQVLLVDLGCDAPYVETTGLPRQVRVAPDSHAKCLDWDWGRQTWNTKNGRNLGSISTRKIEETLI